MFTTEFLLTITDRENVSRYLYNILLLSLITVFDFLTLFIGGQMIGILLYLAIVSTLSFLGAIIVLKSITKKIIQLEEKHAIGVYPENEFYQITGLLLIAFMVIFPGIVSTTLGFILFIPNFRQSVGRFLTKRLKLDWNAVYEYKEIFNK